jgi:AbrB family looped-hinge helix DNA binding protein
MTQIALVKVTRKGQMTIPVALREGLKIEPGDYVVLRPLMGGILISKATVTPEIQAEDVLRGLVTSMGRAAEQQGIYEEEDLEAVTEDAERRVYEERYGK